VKDSCAYLANDYKGLAVLDVSSFDTPTRTSLIATGGNAYGIHVVNNLAYMVSWFTGLHIYDVSNPDIITEISYKATGLYASDIQVVGEYAYVADFYQGLQIVDVRNPSTPAVIGGLDIGDNAKKLFINGSYAYVADRTTGLHIIDITTKTDPIEVGSFATDGTVTDVYIQNNYAYVAGGMDGLRILDISEPTSPTQIGAYNESSAENVFVNGQYAYLTAGTNGLQIVDISTPSSPVGIGNYDTEGDASNVAVQGQYAYLTVAKDGVFIIDITNPSSPAEVGYYTTGSFAKGIQVKDDVIYLADGDDGLYILTNDFAPEPPTIAEIKLIADDGQEDDLFGRDAAIDGRYAIIGAPYDDNENGVDAGAAYVFEYDGSNWTQTQKIIAADGAADDVFGYAVAISGNNIVVGVPWDDDDGEKSGSVYLYKRNGDAWSEKAKFTASDAGADNRFGIDVGVDAEYVIVGAFFDDDFGTRSGSAYIYRIENAGWVQQEILKASDGAKGDWFGVSVYIDGQYAAVGSRYDDNENGNDAGAVYIFRNEGTDWIEQDKLIASNGAANDLFHINAVHHDYAVVGAYQDDDNGNNSGSAYLFKRSGPNWLQQVKLLASDGEIGENFGADVIMSGSRIAVSAYRDNENGSNSGSVYLYDYDGSGWNEFHKIIATDGAAGDYFGLPIDLDQNHLLVSARNDDDNGENAGAVYIYQLTSRPRTLHVPTAYATISDAMVMANYGDTVKVAPGTYPETVTMTPGVTLVSKSGPNETSIETDGVSQLISGAQDAMVKGFTLAGNDNGTSQPGNAVISIDDNLTVCYCIIRNNRTGFYLSNGSQAYIFNNTIDSNAAGIYLQIQPAPEIYNNIISNNSSYGILRNTDHSLGNPIMQYNNYYGNAEDFGYYGVSWSPEPGTGDLFEDPLFVGGSPFDYHLQSESPCIDGGALSSPYDPDGTRADIGALYYEQAFVEIEVNWPMINGSKERTNWAKGERDLLPPFEHEHEYQVGAADNEPSISYDDGVLFVHSDGSPNKLQAFAYGDDEELWTFGIRPSWADIWFIPAVSDSLIIIAGQGNENWYAVNRFTGEQEWSRPCYHMHSCHPIIDDDQIFLFDRDSLFCLNIDDGSTLWSLDHDNSYTSHVPAVDDRNVYVRINQAVKVLDKTDGSLLWEKDNAAGSIVVDEQFVYCYFNSAFHALHKSDGTDHWSFDSGDDHINQYRNMIAISDDYLCFCSEFKLTETKNAGVHVLDKRTGSQLWHVEFDSAYISTPTIANGIVYTVQYKDWEAGESDLYGFDLTSGEQVFFDDSENYIDQPIVANHTLFVPAIGKVKAFSNQPIVTTMQYAESIFPKTYQLKQNYPNPFNPTTSISYQLSAGSDVKLMIFNVRGQLIRTLVSGQQAAGRYQVMWNGLDEHGRQVASGIYLYRLQAGDPLTGSGQAGQRFTETKKMILVQ